jgi:hypothetical protein
LFLFLRDLSGMFRVLSCMGLHNTVNGYMKNLMQADLDTYHSQFSEQHYKSAWRACNWDLMDEQNMMIRQTSVVNCF